MLATGLSACGSNQLSTSPEESGGVSGGSGDASRGAAGGAAGASSAASTAASTGGTAESTSLSTGGAYGPDASGFLADAAGDIGGATGIAVSGGASGTAGRTVDASTSGGVTGNLDAPAAGGASGTGGAVADPCNPSPPSGTHAIHFRYYWAGQKTFTLFPKPALMPKTVEMQVTAGTQSTTVTCNREQDRPWFNCPVPDTYFTASSTWRVSDKGHTPEWNTVAQRALPSTPQEYWLHWLYGKPDVPRTQDPPNFEFLDYYPDAAYGDWSAGGWNDSACASKGPSSPRTIGFGQGGWFPYASTQYKYPYGGSLAYVYSAAAQPKFQDALDAFVFERYNLWKKNWVKYDSDACGTGTARVYSDNPVGTVSEGQGYGMAMSAAIGDKALFDQLWNFVRHYRSQAQYCGLTGWMWQTSADCQAVDTFATTSGNHDSAFDGDVDIGIGLVYAALQWPEYTSAATDWLVRMECEVNTKYGDGYNYPTNGGSWDKTCADATHCDYAPQTASSLYVDFFPPGYFRAFGDFLAAKLGSTAAASNDQSHHDFWYRTAETVWELVERCYDVNGVHPGLMGNQGDVVTPCSAGGGSPYEWGRAFWRLAIDAAWFGNNTDLPENAPNSSKHYTSKSRIQAKMDNIQDFYAGFYKKNPPEPNANRFSTLCDQLGTDDTVTNCDPAYGHNGYTVNMAMCPFTTLFDDGGATTSDIRREALEEALSTSLLDQHYFEESLGVYSLLFLSGNFPNPVTVPGK
jgi:hypothetical protein